LKLQYRLNLNRPAKQLRETITVGLLKSARIIRSNYAALFSFLDLDEIPDYHPDAETVYKFSGKRIGRRNRLYRTKDGRIICADVNGAYNILRKRRPDAFSKAKGVAAYVVQPARLPV
jgi:putative transposase